MKLSRKMKLAIITESLRRDNHAPLRFFQRIEVHHFYWTAPYKDMAKEEFSGATKFDGPLDLYRKLTDLQPDIIQGSEPYASKKSLLLSLIALIASRRLQIPLIFPTLENLTPRDRFGGVVGPLVEWFFSLYAKRARKIIALNNGAAANLRVVGIPDTKIIRFPWGIWGVDRTVFRPTKQIPHPALNHPTILFVGRIDPEKGIRDLLHSFAMLAKEHPDWQLILIGPGTIRDEVLIFARANRLADRIHLLGVIPNKELASYFSAARVTVYPSVTAPRGETSAIQGWAEQVGTVILQSLACGTPVVGTSSGAIPEYLRDDVGLLVPEHDPEALAKAINRLMVDDGLRTRLSTNGQRYIAENFDAEKNVERAEDMLLSWLHH